MKIRRLNNIFLLIVVIFFSTIYSYAQSNEGVDLSFNASATKELETDTPQFALQPDGKIIIFGSFSNVSGVAINRIARLNTDGSLDNSFNCVECNFFIRTVVAQADGKILVSGRLDVGSTGTSRLIRLNPDGSKDFTFNSFLNGQQAFNPIVSVLAVRPDGKIIAGIGVAGSLFSQFTIYRLNSDGSQDTSFAPLGINTRSGIFSKLLLLPDGKLLIAGRTEYGYIARVNLDGTKDTTFESPMLTLNPNPNPFAGPMVADVGLQSDGKVVFTGKFDKVNGIDRSGFARLNSNSSLDMSFFAPGSEQVSLKVLSNDKILLRTSTQLSRLNADGTPDNTFLQPGNLVSIYDWILDSSERIILSGKFNESGVEVNRLARLNTNGSIETLFNTTVGSSAGVTVVAVQTDGKVLFAGDFTRASSALRNGFARVNANGSIDTSFNIGDGFSGGGINAIAVQTDGKILVGGSFSIYNGIERKGLVRLNSDGSLDTAFDPLLQGPGTINAIAIQPDGKILIGGVFTSVNEFTRASVARLNANGTLDTAFNPVFGSPVINSILLLADGKIMVGGSFTGANGFPRSNLVRLNSDSSLDTAFNAGISTVQDILVQSDGKYLVNANSLTRLNGNGSADSTFQSPVIEQSSGISSIQTIFIQPDGSIIIGGMFNRINGNSRTNLARLSSNGTFNALFVPSGASDRVNTIVGQSDGKIIVGGQFALIGNVPRTGIARLSVPDFRRVTNYDFDGDGLADVSVFRPSTNTWYILQSSNFQVSQQVFGLSGDIATPADFDGDGKTDLGIFRPSTGTWWYKSSVDGVFRAMQWGASGDIPLPSDYTGDGKADFVIYRPSQNMWYRFTNGANSQSNIQFGAAGDLPLIGDFDGDGKTDPAIFRPSTGDWWWQSSSDNIQRAAHWGVSTDKCAPADYDGDGKTDLAVYRPSTGVWYILQSSTGTPTIMQFGVSTDKAVAADYDGDGKADIAVFRPSEGNWYMLRSTAGFWGANWGISTDVPLPNTFIQ